MRASSEEIRSPQNELRLQRTLLRVWRTVSIRACASVIAAAFLLAIARVSTAQSVSTASIRGAVRDEDGALLSDARVRLINRATGHYIDVVSHAGRFTVAGLEVGERYSIVVRRIGFQLYARESVVLALGEPFEIDVAMQRFTASIAPVEVVAKETDRSSGARMGIGTRIGESPLHALPTLNRDLYDFVQLTPELSVRGGLISGGGMGPRYNNFLIDGVSQRHLQGSLPTGGFNGGKSVSIEAVREYEVILSAFDVRYGDFAGAMVNAVTRRGTNQPSGSVFAYGRNERLAQSSSFLRASPYERLQYGFTVGGPILPDLVHFFVATELQRLTAPANGAYLGQEATGAPPPPVTAADVDRFTSILASYGIDAGTGGRVSLATPLANVFGRLDLLLPAIDSRAVLWHNYSHLRSPRFDRAAPSAFPLSSVVWTQEITAHATTLQIFTSLPSGALNELVMAFTENPQRAVPRVRHPLVVVGTTGGRTSLLAGTREIAQGGGEQGQSSLEVANHFSFFPASGHRLAIGARVELFALSAPGLAGTYGRWDFENLDSLASGAARAYTVASGAGGETLRGVQYAAYAGDEWRPTDGLELVAGIRADAIDLLGRPPYNAAIDAIYQRRTDAMPRPRVVLSPRAGFSWRPAGGVGGRVRGGIGVFAARPPLAWLHAAMYAHGGSGTLTCGQLPSDPRAPAFEPDYRLAPRSCADGSGFATGPAHFLDKELRLFVENLRASLAYDRDLAWGVRGTLEGLSSRSLSDFLFVNLKLAGPQSVDAFGRVLYGTIAATGIATPTSVAGRSADVLDVDVRNHSRNYAYQGGLRLERPGTRLSVAGGYAFSRVRDVQSLGAAFPPSNNWRDGRALSKAHESLDAGVSAFEIRHRLVLSATARSPWTPRTDLSLYYVGESGAPFTYVATGGGTRGDLNADGANTNDPIYVPRATTDTNEIRFDGSAAAAAQQQTAFEHFVASSSCLSRQRGRILERNSCRGAWVNTLNASLRQSVVVRGHTFALQLDTFNVLNLLNDSWGHYRQPTVALLQHVAQVPHGTQTMPRFHFNSATRPYTTENLESGYQLQLALRYSF